MLHDGAENRRLELLPFASGLGNRDEVRAEKHAGTPAIPNSRAAAQLGGSVPVAHVERAAGQHRFDRAKTSVAGLGVGSVWMNMACSLHA